MLQSEEREREILLGNKQLLGIFFVVAALLGVAFVGGYKIGQASAGKKSTLAVESPAAASETAGAVQPAGETHSVPPEDAALQNGATDSATAASRKASQDLLGARKKKLAQEPTMAQVSAPAKTEAFTPQGGQEFLQVTAVPHDHALAVASVLRKKGFAAHAVPKPGDTNIYRVIVGPIRDAGELSSTRDSLRKTGFSQVVVQHY